ncbi:MAG: hypothetical protein ACRCXX_14030 [Cetobacterium sp.]|uniref:hypothetical protein n=1 Tax=Cetobacterium sp. TaxID=2071632 RepID=UPI003F3DAFB6
MNLTFDKTTASLGTGVVYATQELGKVAEVADKLGAQVINTACATVEDLKDSSLFALGAKATGAGLVLGGLGSLTGSSTLSSVGETLVDVGVTTMGVVAVATAYKNRNVSVEEVQAFIKTTDETLEVEGV